MDILLKLYLKSLRHNGKLLLNEMTPLSAEMITLLTRYEIGTVERAIRAFSGKPFIITTNLSLEKLQNPADLEHGRIYGRIMERCVPIAFSGKNYRTGKGRANMENASGILRE